MANTLSAPTSDEQYFLSIDWCASLIQSGKYILSVPDSRRYKTSTTEDAFFGNTLNNPKTIPACLMLYPKSMVLENTQSEQSAFISSVPSSYPLHQPSYSPTTTYPASQSGTHSADHVLSVASSFLFPIPSLQVLVALEHGVNAYPHLSHGGLIATLLDESMGMLLTLNGALDEEKRVTLPDGASRSSEVTGVMNNMRVADGGGNTRKSDRNSIDMKNNSKPHQDSAFTHDTQQNNSNQLNKGQRSAISLEIPQTKSKEFSPSISAVTKELRIQYRRPVRTPAVVIISVTFAREMEAQVGYEVEETGKEHHSRTHGNNRDASNDKGLIAGTSQRIAATSAAALTPTVNDFQRNSKLRDFAMRAIIRDRYHGRTLAIGDAVFTMPRPKSKHEPKSTTKFRSRL